MAKVKGTTLIHRFEYCKEKGTQEQYDLVLQHISPDFRKVVERGIMASLWYPFEWYIELLTVMDAILGRGDLALTREIGYTVGMKAGTGLYKLFFKIGTVKFILERASSFWRQLFDTGVCETVIESDYHGKMYVRDFPNLPKAACLSLAGWCQAVVELSGGKQVSMEVTQWPEDGNSTLEITGSWK